MTRMLNTSDLRWLRGLAQSLIGEPDGAEDLVQETVIAAMEGAPPSGDRRRAWLRSVASRLAARRFRDRVRRTRREKRAAQSEALPDSSELLERAEVAEQVVAAVRRMPEPFRRTILLRFLEGQTPDEMAQREGSPVDTVRWRVRRGLQLLRDELVRRHDRDWSSWSLLLLPLARGSGDAGVATAGTLGGSTGWVAGGLVMKPLGLAFAAVLSGAGLWFVWERSSTDEDATDVMSEQNSEAADLEVAARPDLTPTRTRMEEASSDGMAPPPGRTESESDLRSVDVAELEAGLRGRVVDEFGTPVPATVYLVPAREPPGAGQLEPLTTCDCDSEGRFVIAADRTTWNIGAEERLDLGVVANGFVRQVVPDVLVDPEPDEMQITLRRGRGLVGRVEDRFGRAVPGVQLLAHTANGRIDHVSPTQVLLRARRAELGDASSAYHQCLATSDARGEVAFSGFPAEPLTVRSVDPGWAVVAPGETLADDSYVVWKVDSRMGVRVHVVDEATGDPVDRTDAVFCAKVTFADGQQQDYSQWVGRGRDAVSFVLNEEVLPPLKDRVVQRVAFYGTVESGGVEVAWKADPIDVADDAGGVAEVQVAIDLSSDVTKATESLPTGFVELDVRYEDDETSFTGALAARWTVVLKDGSERQGSADVKPADGVYRFAVPEGLVYLQAQDRDASGSLYDWSDVLECVADTTTRARVQLPRGAAVSIERPSDWSGVWFVRASWRLDESSEWRGSWNYSTEREALDLTALRPAEWRFELRRSRRDTDPLVRTVSLWARDVRIVGE